MIEPPQVFAVQRSAAGQSAFGVRLCDALQEQLEPPGEITQHLLAVDGAPDDLPERNGIRRVALETFLIEIETDTDEGVGDLRPVEGVGQEHAANFAIAVIDVVGPLHADAFGVSIECVRHGQTGDFGKQKLLGGRDMPGAESETEGEVLGRRTFPHGVHLSVAAGLEIGRDELHFSVGEPIGVQELHGGSHLIEVAPMPMGRKFRRSDGRVHGRWGHCAADRGRKRQCNDECGRAARCRRG